MSIHEAIEELEQEMDERTRRLASKIRTLESDNAELRRKLELFQWGADNDVSFESYDDGYECSILTSEPNPNPPGGSIEGYITEEGPTAEEAIEALRKKVEGE